MTARTIVTKPTRYGPAWAPSHRIPCSRCGQATWLSNRADIDDSVVICVVCAMAVVEPGHVIELAPWVDADLAAANEAGDPSAEL